LEESENAVKDEIIFCLVSRLQKLASGHFIQAQRVFSQSQGINYFSLTQHDFNYDLKILKV